MRSQLIESSNLLQEEIKLYVHHRDMMPGALKSTERLNAMGKSRKIIFILSNSYVNSNECHGEIILSGMFYTFCLSNTR